MATASVESGTGKKDKNNIRMAAWRQKKKRQAKNRWQDKWERFVKPERDKMERKSKG